ncbi:hypothetical protein FACS1894211_10580 [Clostridia bacterium]|nr:hypothetical protein FACS1894211_10580 [Clostridia bacterium]
MGDQLINHWGQACQDALDGNAIKKIESTAIITLIDNAQKDADEYFAKPHSNNSNQRDTTAVQLFFRGESKDYPDSRLLPSVFRAKKGKREYNEKEEYYDALTNFPDELADLSNLSKLAKMQHYNYPTRLLDLTTNPLVALWFACSDYSRYRETPKVQKDGYFYIVATKTDNILTCDSDKALLLSCLAQLKEDEMDALLKFLREAIAKGKSGLPFGGIDKQYVDPIIEKSRTAKEDIPTGVLAFQKLISEATRERTDFANYRTIPKHLLSTFVVRPMVQNERQKAQHGLFAIFGLPADGNENYHNSNEYFIKRYMIPNQMKMVILKQLDKLGINEATLFGDLESRTSHNRWLKG